MNQQSNRVSVFKSYYIVFVLYLVNVVLVVDKVIFSVLLEPIRAEFGLSDSQLGILAGTVYAVSMGLASIPLGMLADRVSRRNIIASCLMIWSGMTALCGMAANYVQLLIARCGVGMGEAGGGPASLSLISDLFSHKRRATAMAIFSLGTPTAALINLGLNTKLVNWYGWRMTLVIVSVVGIALAILMMLSVPEPKRGSSDKIEGSVKAPPFLEVMQFVFRQKSLLRILLATLVAYVVLAGVSSWHFSYLIRTFNIELHVVGPILGAAIAGTGIVGLMIAGITADYFGKRDEKWRTRIMGIGALLSIACGIGAFTSSVWSVNVIFAALFAATVNVWLGPVYALTQSLVGLRMRATVGAIIFMIANMIGYGIGPMLLGFLSDMFTAMEFGNSLKSAILTVIMLNFITAIYFFRAGKTLNEDLARVEKFKHEHEVKSDLEASLEPTR